MLPVEEEEGAAGVAAALLPGAGAGEPGELAVVFEVVPEGLPPTPPSIVKGPAKASLGDVPSSKASINIIDKSLVGLTTTINLNFDIFSQKLTVIRVIDFERNLPNIFHISSIHIGSNCAERNKSIRFTLG